MSVAERLKAMDQLWDPSRAIATRYLRQTGIKKFWLTGRHEPSAEKQSFSLWINSDPVYEALDHDRRNTEDAAEDLELGAQFYESCATGVGDYFLDSILSDLNSLVLSPVFIQSTLDSIGCCRSDFHSASIMRWKTT